MIVIFIAGTSKHTHLNRPDSRPGANVKNLLWVVEWDMIEFVVHDQFEHVMLHVKAIELLLVVGIWIG